MVSQVWTYHLIDILLTWSVGTSRSISGRTIGEFLSSGFGQDAQKGILRLLVSVFHSLPFQKIWFLRTPHLCFCESTSDLVRELTLLVWDNSVLLSWHFRPPTKRDQTTALHFRVFDVPVAESSLGGWLHFCVHLLHRSARSVYHVQTRTVRHIENMFFFMFCGNNAKRTSTWNKKKLEKLKLLGMNGAPLEKKPNAVLVFIMTSTNLKCRAGLRHSWGVTAELLKMLKRCLL